MSEPTPPRGNENARKRLVGRLIQSGTFAEVHITREAVESTVTQLQRGPVPSFIEHDHTQPPVGRVIGGRLVELDDGEVAAESIIEIFNETSPAYIHSESQFNEAVEALTQPAAVAGPFEILIDSRSYDLDDVDAIAEAARSIGEVRVRDSAVRFSALPDPLLAIGLGSVAVAWGWFAKGFFTRLGEALADEVSEDLKHAYRQFKSMVLRTVAEKRRPIDQDPITLLSMSVEGPSGRHVKVEGSTRTFDERLERFLDAGMDLAIVGRAYVDLAHEPDKLALLHFRYGPRGWQFAYALDEDAERLMIAVVSDDEYDELVREARAKGSS
jgi:hypothetical protein